MKLGLRRGTVALEDHDPAWETAAQKTIEQLHALLGPDAVDIQHVGSTAIHGIPAKPILDIAVGVRKLEDCQKHDPELTAGGFLFRGSDVPGALLYVLGEGEIRTNHIHVLTVEDPAWQNYLNFRDYLNAFPEEARRYARLKVDLAASCSNDRGAYTQGKQALIQELLQKAALWRAK